MCLFVLVSMHVNVCPYVCVWERVHLCIQYCKQYLLLNPFISLEYYVAVSDTIRENA